MPDTPWPPPLDIATLRAWADAGRALSYRFFWGHRGKATELSDSCFSQWWPSPLEVEGSRYASAEHYMMVAKARLFGDEATASLLMACEDPREAKRLGRLVKGYSEALWSARRFDVVTEGNLAKFSQSGALGRYLLSTGEDILVEASPVDAIWGIGLSRDDARSGRPGEWPGLNLLGFALMRVRSILRLEAGAPAA